MTCIVLRVDVATSKEHAVQCHQIDTVWQVAYSLLDIESAVLAASNLHNLCNATSSKCTSVGNLSSPSFEAIAFGEGWVGYQTGNFVARNNTVSSNGSFEQLVQVSNLGSKCFVVQIEGFHNVGIAAVWITFFAWLNIIFEIGFQDVCCLTLEVVLFHVGCSGFAGLLVSSIISCRSLDCFLQFSSSLVSLKELLECLNVFPRINLCFVCVD